MSEAIKFNPGMAEAYYIQGCCLHRLGRIADALTAFDCAVANKPLFVERLVNRGSSLMALNRHNEALEDFRKVIAVNPKSRSLGNCGGILLNLNRHEEALAYFERALAISPDLTEALANRAAALMALKRFGDAAGAFEKLLRMHPDLPRCARSFGVLQIAKLASAALDAGPLRYCGGAEPPVNPSFRH